jgi:aerobic-type carbon monoxide dehydrogenase small subunit (CoxS/CutS family)
MADQIALRVNGTRHKLALDGTRTLLSVLRTELHLTGPKFGCGAGQCGACTVLLDDQAVRSCITPVSAVAGHSVTTIEGLATNGKLHPVQEAFLEAQAMQCGYCTPGMIMSTVSLLRRNPRPSEDQIRDALAGNLCRCAVYQRILSAVQRAAQKMAR